jgi:xanthine dehydrogenase YagT iron-sulfur-binding subunit
MTTPTEVSPTTQDVQGWRVSRRTVVQVGASLASVGIAGCGSAQRAGSNAVEPATHTTDAPPPAVMALSLRVNGQTHALRVDTRSTVLDTLREGLGLKGTKKGCDHGQCGACTVLIDGRRINSCLTLAVMHDGQEITTIEGLSTGELLHPMQAAFLKHDGFQCGYCTPGQICSSVGMLAEARRGMPSHVTADLTGPSTAMAVKLSDDEIRERMSGNLCRCSAYPNIVAAIREVAGATS